MQTRIIIGQYDENCDGFIDTMGYKTAVILSEALRIRDSKINNKWLILDAETQNAILMLC